MKTKQTKKNKINIITLGCAKNLFDSEVMMAQLSANNFDVEHEAQNDDAQIVIVNTCGFIDKAKEESINTILDYAKGKKSGIIDKLYVSGCLTERYREELEIEIPEVDAFFGTRELPRLLGVLKADYKKELVGERLLTTPQHYAYLKIAEGCDRPCSFCAIPLIRGKHRSTPIEQLVEQTKKLASKGVKELILIAQDLTYYGLDIYKKRRLADLLRELSLINGIEWIRLHYAYPSGFPMDVIEEMRINPKICKYLDIPLQHGSSKILKLMKRGINREKTSKLILDIKNIIPEIVIRTTLIAGFPGETKEDFKEMYDWVNEMNFGRLGIFTYSHEDNTSAYNLTDDVPEDIKSQRAEQIMDLQTDISYNLNKKRIGKTYKVLVDKEEGDYFIGRTQFDSPDVDNQVFVKRTNDSKLNIGEFVNIKINSSDHFDLYGEIV